MHTDEKYTLPLSIVGWIQSNVDAVHVIKEDKKNSFLKLKPFIHVILFNKYYPVTFKITNI